MKIACVGVIGIHLIMSINLWGNDSSFLTPQAIYDGWMKSYGHIRSMEVAYKKTIQKLEGAEDYDFSYLHKYEIVEKQEAGQKYHWKELSDNNEITGRDIQELAKVAEYVCDGSVSTQYYENSKQAVIKKGPGSYRYHNDFRKLLIASILPGDDVPQFAHNAELEIAGNLMTVQPKLDTINGQDCHVLETTFNNVISRIWVAHTCGMLPMKQQFIIKGVLQQEVVAGEIAYVDSPYGKVWYPKSATVRQRISEKSSITYSIEVDKFIPYAEFEDSVFTIDLPEGTQIGDADSRMFYIKGGTDGMNSSKNHNKLVSLSGKKLPDLETLNLPVDPNAMGEQAVLLCFCDMGQRPSRHGVEELVKKAGELKGKGVMSCYEPNETAAGEKEAEIQAGGSNSQLPQVALECRILSIFDKKGVETFFQKKVVIEGNSSAYIITEQDVEDLFQLMQRHKKSKSLECPHVIIFSGKEGNIRFVSENNIGFSLQAVPAVNRENRYVGLAVEASEILPAGSPVQTIKIPATVESGQTLLVMAPPGFLREFLQEKDSPDSTVLLLIKPSILLSDTPVSLVGKALPEMAALHLPVDPNAMGEQAVLLCFCDMSQRPSRHGVEELVKKAGELKGKGVWAAVVQAEPMGQKELEEWKAKYQIPFPVGMIGEEGEKVLAGWGVRGRPWLILTDRQQVVRAEGFGVEELEEKLKKVIGEQK